MAPPPLSPTIRYFPPGIRRVYFVLAFGNYNLPLRSEINAGVDLTAEVQAMSGWSVTSAPVDVPDMGSRFVSQVPGRLTSATNDITCYVSQNSIDARAVLTRDTNGFVCICWDGDIVGQKMDIFPVRIMSAAMDSAEENAGACVFSFAATKLPAINVVIPG